MPIELDGLKPFTHRVMVFGRDHVTLLVFNEFERPTRSLKQMGHSPTVFDRNTYISRPVHPKEVFWLQTFEPNTEFHRPHQARTERDDTDDSLGERQLKHLLSHGTAHAESAHHKWPGRSVVGDLLFQLCK